MDADPTIADVLAEVRRGHRLSAALLLPARDAALLLGVSKATLYRMIAAGQAPRAVQVKGLRRWRRADLERCVARLTPGRPKRREVA